MKRHLTKAIGCLLGVTLLATQMPIQIYADTTTPGITSTSIASHVYPESMDKSYQINVRLQALLTGKKVKSGTHFEAYGDATPGDPVTGEASGFRQGTIVDSQAMTAYGSMWIQILQTAKSDFASDFKDTTATTAIDSIVLYESTSETEEGSPIASFSVSEGTVKSQYLTTAASAHMKSDQYGAKVMLIPKGKAYYWAEVKTKGGKEYVTNRIYVEPKSLDAKTTTFIPPRIGRKDGFLGDSDVNPIVSGITEIEAKSNIIVFSGIDVNKNYFTGQGLGGAENDIINNPGNSEDPDDCTSLMLISQIKDTSGFSGKKAALVKELKKCQSKNSGFLETYKESMGVSGDTIEEIAEAMCNTENISFDTKHGTPKVCYNRNFVAEATRISNGETAEKIYNDAKEAYIWITNSGDIGKNGQKKRSTVIEEIKKLLAGEEEGLLNAFGTDNIAKEKFLDEFKDKAVIMIFSTQSASETDASLTGNTFNKFSNVDDEALPYISRVRMHMAAVYTGAPLTIANAKDKTEQVTNTRTRAFLFTDANGESANYLQNGEDNFASTRYVEVSEWSKMLSDMTEKQKFAVDEQEINLRDMPEEQSTTIISGQGSFQGVDSDVNIFGEESRKYVLNGDSTFSSEADRDEYYANYSMSFKEEFKPSNRVGGGRLEFFTQNGKLSSTTQIGYRVVYEQTLINAIKDKYSIKDDDKALDVLNAMAAVDYDAFTYFMKQVAPGKNIDRKGMIADFYDIIAGSGVQAPEIFIDSLQDFGPKSSGVEKVTPSAPPIPSITSEGSEMIPESESKISFEISMGNGLGKVDTGARTEKTEMKTVLDLGVGNEQEDIKFNIASTLPPFGTSGTTKVKVYKIEDGKAKYDETLTKALYGTDENGVKAFKYDAATDKITFTYPEIFKQEPGTYKITLLFPTKINKDATPVITTKGYNAKYPEKGYKKDIPSVTSTKKISTSNTDPTDVIEVPGESVSVTLKMPFKTFLNIL